MDERYAVGGMLAARAQANGRLIGLPFIYSLEELRKANFENAGKPKKCTEADILGATLYGTHKRTAKAGLVGQFFLAHTSLFPQSSYPGPELFACLIWVLHFS